MQVIRRFLLAPPQALRRTRTKALLHSQTFSLEISRGQHAGEGPRWELVIAAQATYLGFFSPWRIPCPQAAAISSIRLALPSAPGGGDLWIELSACVLFVGSSWSHPRGRMGVGGGWKQLGFFSWWVVGLEPSRASQPSLPQPPPPPVRGGDTRSSSDSI